MNNIIKGFLLFLTLFTVNAVAEAPYLEGEFEVSGGQATYTLPIDIPMAQAGYKPVLSLAYNSGHSNGVLGVGWSVKGQSAISRCSRDLSTDGRWGGVQFNSSDRYCIDGVRLIAVTGADGNHLTEYKTEIDDGNKYVSYNRIGSGPEYFKVWTPDGDEYTYGANSNSRLAIANNIVKWSLSEKKNQTNNKISYQYINDANTLYLDTINYVGGKVKFNYQDRPDYSIQYFKGAKISLRKRQHNLKVYGATNNEVYTFSFEYIQSPNVKLSLLSQIRKTYQGNELKPINFTWKTNHTTAILPNNISVQGKVRLFHDAERDGILEYFDDSKLSGLNYNDRKGLEHAGVGIWSHSGKESIKQYASSHADINNDGIDEVVNSWQGWADLNGDGKDQSYSIPSPSTSDKIELRKYIELDINADGIADAMSFYKASRRVKIHSSKGRDIWKKVYYSRANINITNGNINLCKSCSKYNISDLLLNDINNDGYLDLIFTTGGKLYYSIFDGVRFLDEKYITDISGKLEQVTDINNNNINEIIIYDLFDNQSKVIYLNSDLNLLKKESYHGFVSYLDYNADTILDRITYDSNVNSSTIVLLKDNAVPKIAQIKQYNRYYNIQYHPISDTTVHKQEFFFQYPVLNTTPSMTVVSHVEDTGQGEYDYFYNGAKSHVNGGGFLGFRVITETSRIANVTTKIISYYEQSHSVGNYKKYLPTGKLIRKETFIDTHKILEERFDYQYHKNLAINGIYWYRIDLLNHTAQKRDITNADLGKIITNFTYNAIGQLTNKNERTILTGKEVENKSEVYSYISTGLPSHNVVYQSQNSLSNTIAQKLSKFEHLDLWCGKDNKQYIKPRNKFVLIHGEIITPILTANFPYFYRLNILHGSYNSTSNVNINTTTFTSITEAVFNEESPQRCGEYFIHDYNGDGLQDIVSAKGSSATLVTESGREYWKASAISQLVTTVLYQGLTKTAIGKMTYDRRGLLLSQTTQLSDYDSNNIGSKSLYHKFQYDNYGNIITEETGGTNTASRIIKTEFDSRGLFAVTKINALGHKTQFEYDPQFGLVSKITDPNNRVTTNTYDEFGRLKQYSLPGNNNWTIYNYYFGNQCQFKESSAISCVVTQNNQRGTIYEQFDSAGREVRDIHQAFDGRWIYVDKHWDKKGRKIRHSRPSFEQPDSTMSNVPYSLFAYDSLDREIYKKEPSDSGNGWHESHISYQGFKETITEDKNGSTYTKIITKNILGQIAHIQEPLGAWQSYTYYPDGKLKTTVDSANNITTIQYDNLGYRNRLIDPDLGTWTYDYNAFGELIYKRDANGKVTKINYDRLGRKTQEDVAGRVSTWAYDNRGKGLIYKQTSPGYIKEFFYINGLLTEEKMVAKGQTLLQRYQYDGFERLTQETRPNDLVLQYVYNQYGYQSAVRSPKTAADSVFTSQSFQQDVRSLINDATSQAQKYLDLANRYAQQRDFFNQKVKELDGRSVDINQLDSQSWGILKGAQRFKKYCNSAGICYLQPATWLIIHGDIAVPIDVNSGEYYRLSSRYNNTRDGNKYYDITVYAISSAEFNNSGATKQDELVAQDYDGDGDGSHDLISQKHSHGVYKDVVTQQAINLSVHDLALSSEIANKRYNSYRQLASQLISLSQQVAKLSSLFNNDVNNLNQQKKHLQTIIKQSELAKANKDGFIYYWQRTNTDAYDHTTSEVLGNGLANSYVHSQKTGRVRVIATHKASDVVSQSNRLNNIHIKNDYRYLSYDYDNWGNVTQRYDRNLGLNERFTYDLLDRVTRSTPLLEDRNQHGVNNPDFNRNFDYRYDNLGNIIYKTDVGSYRYNSSHKHAVTQAGDTTYSYDAVGNMVLATKNNKTERIITWTDFNKPQRITRNGHTTSFEYDANQNRFYREDSSGKQTLYFSNFYEQVYDTKTKLVEHKQYVYADGKLIALHIIKLDSLKRLKDKQIRYMHYDALESVDMITDGYGLVVERRSFDAWGKARKLLWQDLNNPATLVQFSLTNRGFTGHEHLEEVSLIHMNGRVYDPDLGRFISADPMIQAPFMTNSFNRYSYVMNNPLKYHDPTGYTWGDSFGGTCNTDGSMRNSAGNRNGSWKNNSNGSVDIKMNQPNSRKYGNEIPKSGPNPQSELKENKLDNFGTWAGNVFSVALYESLATIPQGYVEINGFLESLRSDESFQNPSKIAIGFGSLAIGIVTHKYKKLEGAFVTKSIKEFDTVPYRPTNSPFVNHHGVNDVWAKNNISGYKSRAADNPTMDLSVNGHKAAHRAGNDYLKETMGSVRSQAKNLSPRQMQKMAERWFDAANIPMAARQNFYNSFNRYTYGK